MSQDSRSKSNRITKHLDRLGMCTSGFCAIHCLVTPFLLIALPYTGIAFLETEGFELGLLVTSVGIALFSFTGGILWGHKKVEPSVLALLGISALITSKLFEGATLEIVLSVIGGIILIIAHTFNHRLNKRLAAA